MGIDIDVANIYSAISLLLFLILSKAFDFQFIHLSQQYVYWFQSAEAFSFIGDCACVLNIIQDNDLFMHIRSSLDMSTRNEECPSLVKSAGNWQQMSGLKTIRYICRACCPNCSVSGDMP